MKSKIFTILCVTSLSAFAGDETVGVDVAPRSSGCLKNTPCLVASSHYANVINHTNTPRTIYVKYSICPQNEDCRRDQYKVVVGRGQWQDSKIMQMLAKYHYNGDFFLDAETTVYDENYKILQTIKKRGKIQIHG